MNRGVRRRLLSLGVWPALLDAADHVVWKLQLFILALLHLLFSSDKHWLSSHSTSSSSPSAGAAPETSVLLAPSFSAASDAAVVTKRKRVLFVRHAESEWNVVFNRGLNLRALVSLLRAVAREWLLLPSGDSVFLDSPLSRRGRFQAQSLRDHVSETPLCSLAGGDQEAAMTAPLEPVQPHRHSPPQSEESTLLRYLCCPVPGSVVVASNLRRTIDTARIASASRLETPGERIHVLSCLQEIGRNLDTLALSAPHSLHPHEVLVQGLRGEKRHDELFNVAESHGNKAVLDSGRDRLLAFAHWVFKQQKDVVVVYGHSLWFRAFCREFFPSDVHHEAKEAKMSNCGVVTFMLEERNRGGGEAAQYSIQPESFQHLV